MYVKINGSKNLYVNHFTPYRSFTSLTYLNFRIINDSITRIIKAFLRFFKEKKINGNKKLR